MNPSIIFSTPLVGTQTKGGPFRVLGCIQDALETKFKDELVVINGEGMPPDEQTLDMSGNFDQRAVFAVEEVYLKFGQPKLFFGTGYCSLLQMHQLLLQSAVSTRCKLMICNMSTEHRHAAALLSKEYQAFGVTTPPISERQLWRGEEEHKLVDAVLVPAGPCAKTYEESPNLQGKKVFGVNFGVDSKLFHPDPKARMPIFSVLFAGGNTIRKGMNDLLNAWNAFTKQMMPGERLKVQLGLLGVSYKICQKCNAQFGALFKDCPNCKSKQIAMMWQPPERTAVYGWVQEETLPGFYRQHQVFCLPSYEEGQPLAAWEAMASGMPIIVTPECGIPITDHEEGLLVQPHDIRGIKERIEYFYKRPDEIARMGANARKLAMKHPWSEFKKDVVKSVETLLAA